jgi:hypothetical protein
MIAAQLACTCEIGFSAAELQNIMPSARIDL